MTTRKIADLPPLRGAPIPGDGPCLDPQHDVPTHQVFEPGIYEHTCPGCGRSFQFTVDTTSWLQSRYLARQT